MLWTGHLKRFRCVPACACAIARLRWKGLHVRTWIYRTSDGAPIIHILCYIYTLWNLSYENHYKKRIKNKEYLLVNKVNVAFNIFINWLRDNFLFIVLRNNKTEIQYCKHLLFLKGHSWHYFKINCSIYNNHELNSIRLNYAWTKIIHLLERYSSHYRQCIRIMSLPRCSSLTVVH